MPIGLGAGLGLGGGRSATSSGAQGGGGVAPYVNEKCCSFDGVDDNGEYTPGICNNTTDYSLSFWFKCPSLPSGYGAVWGDDNGTAILIYSTGQLAFRTMTYAAYGVGWKFYAGVISGGAWYHVVCTKQRNSGGAASPTFSHYLNGSLLGTDSAQTDASGRIFGNAGGSDLPGNVGSWNGTSNELGCLVDEFGIWTSALSSSDVTDIYNSGEPGDLTSHSPRNWYRFGDGTEAGSGTTVYDMGADEGTTTDMTLQNGPTYSTDVAS